MQSEAPRSRFLRRVDVRLTLWFAGIFLFAALLLFGFSFVNLYQALEEEDRQALQARALGYVVRYRSAVNARAGINVIVNELSNDVVTPTGEPFFARIATVRNEQVFLAIPLREWQQIDLSPLTAGDEPHAEGFLTVPAPRYEYALEVLGVRLNDDYVLQIGSDTRNRVNVLRVFQTSFFFTFAIMLGVSLAAGLFFASRSLRPIGSLNATVRSIIQTGDLDRRIPTRQSNDDLDDMTEAVNAMLDRIQTLVAGLRDALDSVAHDLRTPLTRLRSTAERALSSPHGSDELYREALSDALEESERILGMLNAMMDISEAESGAMRLRREETALRELASEVAEVYSLLAEERGMEIAVRIDEPLSAAVDPSRMRQVIGNLYDNAVKYGEPGTTIVVTGHRGHRQDGLVELTVANAGAPISSDELDRIWTRLYRGSGSGHRGDGLGLGLALVRAIVEAHGGEVHVSSNAEEGTRFTIAVPARITEV